MLTIKIHHEMMAPVMTFRRQSLVGKCSPSQIIDAVKTVNFNEVTSRPALPWHTCAVPQQGPLGAGSCRFKLRTVIYCISVSGSLLTSKQKEHGPEG